MKPATENIIIVSLVLATPLGTFSDGIKYHSTYDKDNT